MQPADIDRLRRFALFIALIIITYSIAGVKLDAPAKVSPLGIPFVVNRPDLLPFGLVLASLYSVVRYIYYGYVVQLSPTQARQLLRRGIPVHTPTSGISEDDFAQRIADEVKQYFPRAGLLEAKSSTYQRFGGDSLLNFRISVPKGLWILSFLGDIDYALPVIANVVAGLVYVLGN